MNDKFEFEIKNTNLTLNQNKEFLFILVTNQNNCFHFELHCLEVMVLFYLMISLYCSFVVFFLTPIAYSHYYKKQYNHFRHMKEEPLIYDHKII